MIVWCCSLWCLLGCYSVLVGVNSVLVCSLVWVVGLFVLLCGCEFVVCLRWFGLVGVCFVCYLMWRDLGCECEFEVIAL